MQNLLAWGLRPALLAQLSPSDFDNGAPRIGRVIHVSHGLVTLAPAGRAALGGSFHGAPPTDCPTVGDWVRLDPTGSLVLSVLDRESLLTRRDPNAHAVQLLAANLDTVFITTSANRDLNPRRVERFLVLVRAAGCEPVVVITKADLAEDLPGAVAALRAVAPTVVTTDALHGDIAAIDPWRGPGRTIAFVGASGVGKSTLINAVFGHEVAATSAAREDDDRGRHTTTDRRLHRAPDGTLLIDLPGIREVGLTGDEAPDRAFPEVTDLFARCRWRDCTHEGEAGCAVQAALDDGSLDPQRWAAWQKLQREQVWAARHTDPKAAREQRDRWRTRTQKAHAEARLRDRNRF